MTTPTPITVLLVDDDALIRTGLETILASDPGLRVIAQAEHGLRAVELASRLQPQVILMDIRMPQLDGLAALERIMADNGQARVLMLTTFGEEAYIDRAMAAGASGFLLKSSDPRELINAIRAVAEGAAALSPRIARRVVDRVRGIDDAAAARAIEAVSRLTVREREVLALAGAGHSNAEIAKRLVLTEATVKGYMSTVLAKLEARNRVHAAIIAYQAGMVNA